MVFSEMYCEAMDPLATAMAVATACASVAPNATPTVSNPSDLMFLCTAEWHISGVESRKLTHWRMRGGEGDRRKHGPVTPFGYKYQGPYLHIETDL